uniref:Secreted protein n=1 Tax=Plectus sambesii TaxID=2011161 RepID=A0A914WXJ1_9BILA
MSSTTTIVVLAIASASADRSTGPVSVTEAPSVCFGVRRAANRRPARTGSLARECQTYPPTAGRLVNGTADAAATRSAPSLIPMIAPPDV